MRGPPWCRGLVDQGTDLVVRDSAVTGQAPDLTVDTSMKCGLPRQCGTRPQSGRGQMSCAARFMPQRVPNTPRDLTAGSQPVKACGLTEGSMTALFSLLLLACSADTEIQKPSPQPEPAAEVAPEAKPEAEPQAEPETPARIDVNIASEEELKAHVPGLGDKMAHEFVEYRPYKSVRQFDKEMSKYISAEQIATYRQYIYVPIRPDKSDAATLLQIEGLDEESAQELIAGRPYGSKEAFVAALEQRMDKERVEKAKALLAGKQ